MTHQLFINHFNALHLRVLFLLAFSIGFLCEISNANNLSISNGSVEGNAISFEIGWDNSWNLNSQQGNHDAVWVFLKGRNPSGLWVHIDLSTLATSHSAISPLAVQPVTDGKGVFIYPQEQGVFHHSPSPIILTAESSLTSFSEIRVYGIEMVHIPEGDFFIGDGVSVSSLSNANGEPVKISSENALIPLNLMVNNPNSQFTPHELASSLPAEFPKGFASFYAMKYEVSQLQYADFLNTLTYNQQKSRTASAPNSSKGTYVMINPYQPDSLYRNGIVIVEPGTSTGKRAVYGVNASKDNEYNGANDGQHRAANFLSWADLSAYLDWAALRPMTELEFEKACRGTIAPVAGEFAWGTSLVTNANTPVDDGTIFETVSDVPASGSGLANHGTFIATEGWGLRGVLRNGFAATQSSNRVEAGATYYGVMEMSGNVWEQTVMVGGGGEAYKGNPGDGSLDEGGNANQTSWCNPSTASGVLLKGGGWGSTISEVGSWRDLAVSDRFYSHLKPSTRRNSVGGRGVR